MSLRVSTLFCLLAFAGVAAGGCATTVVPGARAAGSGEPCCPPSERIDQAWPASSVREGLNSGLTLPSETMRPAAMAMSASSS